MVFLHSRKEQHLTIVVNNGAHQFVCLEHGELLQCLGLGQQVTLLHQLLACHHVIHLQAHIVVRQLPPPGGERGRRGYREEDECPLLGKGWAITLENSHLKSPLTVCIRACVRACMAEWLSSYALRLTTPGLRVQTQH